MPPLRPPANFADVALAVALIEPGRMFGRVYLDKYPDPLGFAKTPSRFSDPRRWVDANRFGVVYLGETLKVCFLEAVLRDKRNGVVGQYPISERELVQRRFAEIEVNKRLSLVDLRGDNRVRMGVPSDVAGFSRQTLARAWSVVFHDHPSSPDGIVYPSRLNGEMVLAVYDRAIPSLRVRRDSPLMHAAGLASVLDDLEVAIA